MSQISNKSYMWLYITIYCYPISSTKTENHPICAYGLVYVRDSLARINTSDKLFFLFWILCMRFDYWVLTVPFVFDIQAGIQLFVFPSLSVYFSLNLIRNFVLGRVARIIWSHSTTSHPPIVTTNWKCNILFIIYILTTLYNLLKILSYKLYCY